MNISAQRFFVSILAMPTIIYMAFFQNFREFNEIGLAFPVISTIFIIILMKEVKLFNHLIPFYFFSIAILLLSIYDIMPDSWTRYRDSYAALRQWAWLPILSISATSCYFLIKLNWNFISKHSLSLAVLVFVVSRSVRYYTFGFDDLDTDFFIYGIDNENSIIFALFAIFILYRCKSLPLSIISGVFLIALCSSATSRMAALIILAMLVTRYRKLVVIATTAAGLLFLFASQAFVLQLYQYDPNSSFRALIWRDSSTAVLNTYGFGVGYGTEYIRNDFRAIPADFDRLVEESATDRLFVGTHSSVYDVAMRVGIIGFILLLAGLWRSTAGRITDERYRRLYMAILGSLVVNNTFNMGLASINITFGAGLFFAVLLAARDLSNAKQARIPQNRRRPPSAPRRRLNGPRPNGEKTLAQTPADDDRQSDAHAKPLASARNRIA